MAAKGWISLHRKIQDCFLWENDEPFDRRSAWIDLLLLANHKDAKTMFDGKPIVVKEGQRITSIRVLAQRWGWSTKKTTNFLKVLESENMIVKQSDRKKTLLTIVNYSIYQDVGNSEETQKKHSGDTEETLRKHRLPTNNNDNNENNENNENNNNPPTPLEGGAGKKRTPRKKVVDLLKEILDAKPSVLTDKVTAVMYEWAEYKDQRKDKYVESGLTQQLNLAYKYTKLCGEDAVVDCIRKSIANNYQGITWDKLDQMPRSGKMTTQERSMANLKKCMEELDGDE